MNTRNPFVPSVTASPQIDLTRVRPDDQLRHIQDLHAVDTGATVTITVATLTPRSNEIDYRVPTFLVDVALMRTLQLVIQGSVEATAAWVDLLNDKLNPPQPPVPLNPRPTPTKQKRRGLTVAPLGGGAA